MDRFTRSTPLTYQMAQSVVPRSRPGLEEAFKGIINRLRKYSATSIVDLALSTLWFKYERPEQGLQAAPWLTLLLVKWALQDHLVCLNIGPPMPMPVFYELRQRLWELQGASESSKPGFNIHVMLRKWIYPQLQFQRRPNWGFLRWPALYERLAVNTKNRRQFREVMGMEPAEYMDLATCVHSAVFDGKRSIPADFLVTVRKAYGVSADRIIDLLAKDLPGLRLALQKDEALKVRGHRELYEFPYLSRFPLLKGKDDRLHFWHPIVFSRGLEEAVHIRLSALGAEYTNEFSKVYEAYVTELALSMGIEALDEASFKAQTAGHATAVEAILKGEDCNILVEAKLTLFGDDVMQDREVAVFQRSDRIRQAIKQGWGVGAAVRDRDCSFGDRFQAPHDFLIVVTSRQMLIGTGERLKVMCPAGELDYPDELTEMRLPLSHVIVMSIEEFELTVACVKAGLVDLSQLLRDAVHAKENPATDWLMFAQVLDPYAAKVELPSLITEARQASIGRVYAVLGNT